MRYEPDRKAETRDKLVREAAARMRRAGPNGVGVAGLMRGLGLTHGGFYAHFASKDDLIAQAVTQMFADSSRRYARLFDGLPPADQLAAFIDRYVSAAHRNAPERGCPLTAIASDIPRQGAAARAAFEDGVGRIAARIESMLPPAITQDRLALAMSMLSEMAGAVALSRAVSDPAISDRILAATRAAVRARGALPPQPESDPR